MDRFAQTLYDLGKELDLDLYPDQNRICQLNYHNELQIQIHYDEAKDQIFMGIFLCEVPPGKYREKLLRAGLISNQEYPRTGTLAYSEKNNQFTLFEYIYAPNITGKKLRLKLEALIEKGKIWKDAIEQGRPLPVKPPKSKGGSIFGMKP